MLKVISLVSCVLCIFPVLHAQDPGERSPNQEAVYHRPFIETGIAKTALGGYVEGNTNYFVEDGVTEGFSMELRRFNAFIYSRIGERIRFLSELEFEHGTKEIALETAMLDFKFHHALNFRAGIILPPIGLVNTNHDSPVWEFIDRPLSSTQIIPTTLSEVGFGFHGQVYPDRNWVLSYDVYAVNGLQENIVGNSEGKTFIPAGKSEEMFAEDNNGRPMFSGRVGAVHRFWGELGVSYYGGTYNNFRLEGEEVEPAQNLHLFALDLSIKRGPIALKGEWVKALIDVPESLSGIYGDQQSGAFTDLIFSVYQGTMLGFEDAVLSVALRGEYIDLNEGQLQTFINQDAGDETYGLRFGLCFRPRPETLIRANYSYYWFKDVLGNPWVHTAALQVGVASYF